MHEDDDFENDGSIRIIYNKQLAPLESLLAKVERPGDFYVNGVLEIPMPRVEVEGAGVLSFPVPETQVKALVKQCSRAPYGRGEDTVLDTSVRKVWQLPPGKVSIAGKSWAASFEKLLSQVRRGLGCGETPVTAELYKLLVYDKGGFFLTHRDTEKEPGMFGTLVVVLPCAHRGGELVIRHAGREAVADLCSGEVSELTYAAFYADCEHEVRPVTEGNRVCLVYNLIQRTKTKRPVLEVPRQGKEVSQAAKFLKKALNGSSAPVKLGWLLEHQYSPAELSFATLKNTDAARAGLLCKAAAQAGCTVHLAIVHIEEEGPAEPLYDMEYHRRSRRYNEDTDEDEDDAFEVIEVSSWQHYAAGWVDTENRPAAFGKIPLADGELLPQGALDEEQPDKQRLLEASGNEGCSFERSYRRAALMLWRTERTAEVVLQAGVAAALPLLSERVQSAAALPANDAARREAAALARQITAGWQPQSHYGYPLPAKPEDRTQMLTLLGQLADSSELERFIRDVLLRDYDGSENEALAAACIAVLSPSLAGGPLSGLMTAKMAPLPASCASFLKTLAALAPEAPWRQALREAASAAVARLEYISAPCALPRPPVRQYYYSYGHEPEKEKAPEPADAALVVRFAGVLFDLKAADLSLRAAEIFTAKPGIFDPVKILVPALQNLKRERGKDAVRAPFLNLLWSGSAGFLLDRSAAPPVPQTDWRQAGDFLPKDDDARELQTFLRDPKEQIHHFRMNQARRRSLEEIIHRLDPDLTCITDTKTRPQTLVCTKTRRTEERRKAQYAEDIRAMKSLLSLPGQPPEDADNLRSRLKSAVAAGGEALL